LKRSLLVLSVLYLSLLACNKVKSPLKTGDDPNYLKAKSLLYKQPDSAFYYFNKVATGARNHLDAAFSYNYMAWIQSEAGDYFGAQESLTSALKFLNAHRNEDLQCLSSTYNELGLNSLHLKNCDAAIVYFQQAYQLSKKDKYKLIFLNNQALAYQEKGNYQPALSIYSRIINRVKDRETYARILTNMARTKWLADKNYYAAPELLKSLEIRLKVKDRWGQNSSYAHLADYYMETRRDVALFYARSMNRVARQIGSPDDELESLGLLIKLDAPSMAKAYFERYQQLNDSLVSARGAARNQFALIRYEVERNKTENLRLQKENAEKKYQLVVRNALLIAGFVLLIMVIGSGFMWYRKWKKRKEQEKQEAILDTRRKASKDVHDSLSNDIYLLMKRIKHDEALDRSWLLKHTEFVYKRSRNISYEMLADTDEFFPARIGELLKSFGTEDTKVSLVGNDQILWQKVGAEAKLELKLILQELMVNMQKHSQAANVVVKFEIKGNTCLISYMDDGIGITAGTVHQNGLTNTGTRINTIHGRITFGSNEGRGLRIEISLPLS
jgi:signal transduction histidine kinase